MTNAGDLLASESLLFAIVGVLLGIWYPEISAALKVTIPDQLADAGPQRTQVRQALRCKALPLMIALVLIVAVFLPGSLQAIIHTIRALYRQHWSAFSQYDAVQTSLVLVTILAFALGLYMAQLSWNLSSVGRKLKGPKASRSAPNCRVF